MHYDIAIKRLMELGGKEILREFADVDLAYLDILEDSGQESFDVKRCDYAGRYTMVNGVEGIAVVEFQTRWEVLKPLDLAIYSAHKRRRYGIPVLPILVLFTPDSRATDVYEDENLRFKYRLVRVWETEAAHWLASDNPSLWPIAALASGAEACADNLDTRLHESQMPRRDKSDLLTMFTLFLSLKNVSLARKIAEKRRELMIESPFYEIIKTEGRVEGRFEGRVEGRVSSLVAILDERFGPLSSKTQAKLLSLTDYERLGDLVHLALRSATMEEFEAALG